MLAVPLTVLTQLPLVIAALGWGTQAAIFGVIAGTGALLALSPSIALYFTLFLTPVAVIGSHLIGLARPGATGLTSARTTDWFPLGAVLTVVGCVVTVGAILICVLTGFDPSAISPDMTKAIAREYASTMGEVDPSISSDQLIEMITPAITVTLRILPFAFTMTWTLVGAFNLGLGMWVTAKSGNLLRPREDLAAFDLPTFVSPVLIVALGVAFLGGLPGAIAAAVAGAMAGLLLLAGLAVLHTITRPLSFRLPLLVLVYLFLGLCGLPLIILGILEPYLRLRRRIPPPGPAKPTRS
jgi:hypothetical protein